MRVEPKLGKVPSVSKVESSEQIMSCDRLAEVMAAFGLLNTKKGLLKPQAGVLWRKEYGTDLFFVTSHRRFFTGNHRVGPGGIRKRGAGTRNTRPWGLMCFSSFGGRKMMTGARPRRTSFSVRPALFIHTANARWRSPGGLNIRCRRSSSRR